MRCNCCLTKAWEYFRKRVMSAIRTQVIHQFVYILTQLILYKSNGNIEIKIYLYFLLLHGLWKVFRTVFLLYHIGVGQAGMISPLSVIFQSKYEQKKKKCCCPFQFWPVWILAVERHKDKVGLLGGGDRIPCVSHWHSASRALTCTCTRNECTSASISSANIFRHLHTHDKTISFRIHSQARPADTAVTAAEGNIASVLNVVWWIFKGPFPRL